MKYRSIIFLAVLLCMAVGGQSLGSAHELFLRPQEVTVASGDSVQFEIALFDEHKHGVSGAQVTWNVEPATLGRIDADGLFTAGEMPGKGIVAAIATAGNEIITGHARITVGEAGNPSIKIRIEPEKAHVAPLDSLQFTAIATSPEGVSLRSEGVRWSVDPKFLGMMKSDGTFLAGPMTGEGHITALVGIEDKLYRGEATVIVSPEAKSAIAGAIQDDAGAPLPEAIITATRVGTTAFSRRTASDGAGNYFLGGLIPGWYVVKAEKEGYLVEYYQEASTLLEADPVTLAEEDTATAVDFTLEMGGAISGSVMTADGVTPLAGAIVKAFLPENLRTDARAITDADGTYIIAGLVSGDYLVSASLKGYSSEYYLDAVRPDAATKVTVTQPLTSENINFSLAMKSAITGVIRDAVSGEPVTRAVVTAYAVSSTGPKHQPRSVQDRSDSTGAFLLSLQPGNYYVKVEAKGYAAEWYENALEQKTATKIEVTENNHTLINVDLGKLGQLSGMVTDASTNLPIAGARVSVYSERKGSRRHFEARSDSEGVYQFSALPAGDYLVVAEARDYLPEFWQEADSVSKATRVTVADGIVLDTIHFTLTTGGSISGLVTDAATGLPIAHAVVTVHPQNNRKAWSAHSNAEGIYAVEGLPAGLYYVNCAAPAYLPQWHDSVATRREATAVQVTAPAATEVIDFNLVKIAAKPRSISGMVTDDSTGLPVPNAVIIAMPVMHFARPGKAVTAADGSYIILGLEPGKYVVASHGRGYVGEFYQDVRDWLEATEIEVVADQEVIGIDFGLAPQPQGAYQIAGQVKDRHGKPVGDALVAVFADENSAGYALAKSASSQQAIAAVFTDEAGYFSLESLPADTYTLSASAAGYAAPAPDNLLSVGGGQNIYDAAVTMDAAATEVASSTELPLQFTLQQNYPNPFNPVTTIAYTLPAAGRVSLQVFDLLGREVKILEQGQRPVGRYTAVWDGTDQMGRLQASGVYYYRLRIESGPETFTQIKRMLLLK